MDLRYDSRDPRMSNKTLCFTLRSAVSIPKSVFTRVNIEELSERKSNLQKQIRETTRKVADLYQDFKVYDGNTHREPERIKRFVPDSLKFLKLALSKRLFGHNGAFIIRSSKKLTQNKLKEFNLKLKTDIRESKVGIIKPHNLEDKKSAWAEKSYINLKHTHSSNMKNYNPPCRDVTVRPTTVGRVTRKGKSVEEIDIKNSIQQNLPSFKTHTRNVSLGNFLHSSLFMTESRQQILDECKDITQKNSKIKKRLRKSISSYKPRKSVELGRKQNDVDRQILDVGKFHMVPAEIKKQFIDQGEHISKMKNNTAIHFAGKLFEQMKEHGATVGIDEYVFKKKHNLDLFKYQDKMSDNDFKMKKIAYNTCKIKNRIERKLNPV